MEKRDPDNDRSYRAPRAWFNCKKAFGWRPDVGRNTTGYIINALLDMEDWQRAKGGCIRYSLLLALQIFNRMTDDEKWAAQRKIWDDDARAKAKAVTEKQIDVLMDKLCSAAAPPDNEEAPAVESDGPWSLLPECIEAGGMYWTVVRKPIAATSNGARIRIDYPAARIELDLQIPPDDIPEAIDSAVKRIIQTKGRDAK